MSGILLKIYQYITKQPPGPAATIFIKNISYTSIGSGIAMVIMFAINIIAARLLGPIEYGNYGLVISISQFLMIPTMLGLNSALTRYLSQDPSQQEPPKSQDLIGTTIVISLILSYLFGSIFFLARESFAKLFGVSSLIFIFAILYALSLTLKRIFEAIFQGLHQFKRQVKWELIMTVLIGLAFIYFVAINPHKNFVGYINALLFGYIIYVLGSMIVNLNIGLTFNKHWLKIITAFAALSLGAIVSAFILAHIDRLMLNFFLGAEAVGFYMAYFTASMAIWSRGLTIFINIFFPTAAKLGSQQNVFEKLTVIAKKISLPLTLIVVLMTSLSILLYGPQYPFRWDWIILFALQTALYIFWTTAWWLIASEGKQGAKFTSIHSVIGASLNLGLNFVLIPFLGINGALIATIISSIYFITLAKYHFNSLSDKKL